VDHTQLNLLSNFMGYPFVRDNINFSEFIATSTHISGNKDLFYENDVNVF